MKLPLRQLRDRPLTHLTITTWNIHRGRGEDGKVDAVRTADVLCREVVARPSDILVLQEADEERPPHAGVLDMADLRPEAACSTPIVTRRAVGGKPATGFLALFCSADQGSRLTVSRLWICPGTVTAVL